MDAFDLKMLLKVADGVELHRCEADGRDVVSLKFEDKDDAVAAFGALSAVLSRAKALSELARMDGETLD